MQLCWGVFITRIELWTEALNVALEAGIFQDLILTTSFFFIFFFLSVLSDADGV